MIKEDIKFQILNSKNEIYTEVETDINGYIEFELEHCLHTFRIKERIRYDRLIIIFKISKSQ